MISTKVVAAQHIVVKKQWKRTKDGANHKDEKHFTITSRNRHLPEIVETVNSCTRVLGLVSISNGKAQDSGPLNLHFTRKGQHWQMQLSDQVQKFLEEDIMCAMLDGFLHFGYELKRDYVETFEAHYHKKEKVVRRHIFVFSKRQILPQPVFQVASSPSQPMPSPRERPPSPRRSPQLSPRSRNPPK